MTGLDYFQTVKVVGLASDNAGILAPAQAFVAPIHPCSCLPPHPVLIEFVYFVYLY